MNPNFKTSPLITAYIFLAGGELLVHDQVAPEIIHYDPKKEPCLPVDALEVADCIQKEILAGPVIKRAQNFLWSSYVADNIIITMEKLEEVCWPFRTPVYDRNYPGYKENLTDIIKVMRDVKTIMNQEQNRQFAFYFGPYPGAANLRPELIKVARGHLAPLIMMAKLPITNQKDKELIAKVTLETYSAMDDFFKSLFPPNDEEKTLMDYYVDGILPFPLGQPREF
ncbi:unnamed protein product [Somion occarium]|uniref:Uncharacterized protein n=1 Tax=Somion occarium TaxID=3059160 RepID=A0ABP1CTT8_9APHY